jgi:lipopolysaccharide transport system permease protein
MSELGSSEQLVILKPAKGWLGLDFKELWRYRELIFFLTWRDIKVRYKQAVLGVAWAILQPLVTALVTTFIFERGLKVQTGGPPYPIFMLAAWLPWHLFSNALTRSSTSLVQNANLLTKVYFPRTIIPLSSILSAMVDFCISLGILLGAMFYYKVPLTLNFLWIIPFTLLAMLAALSIGLWFSALNVQYRDIQQMVPFIAQIWFYLTPVLYPINPSSALGTTLYNLNPMVGVVNVFRWAIFGENYGYQAPGQGLLISILVVMLLLIGGLLYFRRMEKTFADLV